MLGELWLHIIQGIGRAYIYTLGLALAIPLAKITDQRIVLFRRCKNRHPGRASLLAHLARNTKTALGIHLHTLGFLIKVDDRWVDRAGFLALALWRRALSTNILHRFGQGK
ncbi:MAG: hypothetical protein Q8Q15_04265, partial [bacterium]|nr:hypothetical protein [bacterium]